MDFTIMKEKKLFKNTDEFSKLNRLNDNGSHFSTYEAIVQALDFEACKEILLTHITYDDLLDSYSKDKNLNNILNKRCYCKNVLPTLIGAADDECWQWDIIGYKMLHNRKTTIKFKFISLADLTCIAKACARMIIRKTS